MARAYASIILKAPVETVWGIVRDFNGLPKWTGVTTSKIEKGLDADVVGCIRNFQLANGATVRERLRVYHNTTEPVIHYYLSLIHISEPTRH